MPHFQGWVSLPYKERTDDSAIMLPFSLGTYTRNDIGSAWLEAIASLKRFAADEPVIVRRNGKRFVQSTGSYVNYLIRSEELGNAAWDKTNASAVDDSATAPDGSATADVVTLDNNVAARVSQDVNASYVADNVIYDFTFFYRRNGGTDVQFRANIEVQDGTLETQTLTAGARPQRAHLSADSLSGGTDLAVSFTQLATPAMARDIEIWGCQVTSRDISTTPGAMPYRRRSSAVDGAGQYVQGEMRFDAADVPAQIFRDKFSVSYLPIVDSAAFGASADLHFIVAILVDEGDVGERTAGLLIRGESGNCVFEWLGDDGAPLLTQAATFDADQEITITMDAVAGTMTIGGATEGNGTFAATATWSITPSDVVIGGGEDLATATQTNAVGYVSEPRFVSA